MIIDRIKTIKLLITNPMQMNCFQIVLFHAAV